MGLLLCGIHIHSGSVGLSVRFFLFSEETPSIGPGSTSDPASDPSPALARR